MAWKYRYRGPKHRSKSPHRCANCGHLDSWHEPKCARCRQGRRCQYFRAPQPPPPPAALLCLRTRIYGDGYGRTAEQTTWRSSAEAMAAERELCAGGCGPRCEGQHMILWFNGDGKTPHVLAGSHDRRLPDDLAERLAVLYPRQVDTIPVELWPAPPEFNEPLRRPRGPTETAERLGRGEALALRQQVACVR
jgi:hypothetical protein